MHTRGASHRGRTLLVFLAGLAVGILATFLVMRFCFAAPRPASFRADLKYRPHADLETSGLSATIENLDPWPADIALGDLAKYWNGFEQRNIDEIERQIARDNSRLSPRDRIQLRMAQVMLLNAKGDPNAAYALLQKVRAEVESSDSLARELLFTQIFLQGITSLRIGENDNCIECRGESSCILPIAPSAVHTNPKGSRQAIQHFTEYLSVFPNARDVRWLLNIAHMTLGEYPAKVDPRFLVNLGDYMKPEFDMGRFRDIGHLVGVNRFGQAGGAIMDDFDNDGLLDLFVTCWDATKPAIFYRNSGDGTFKDVGAAAKLGDQLGGLFCNQADFDNDGLLDVVIVRGAWLPYPVRPSLLRNEGSGRFVDVTEKAGVAEPINSNSAAWADYDNDGWVDLFIPGERSASRLYHNNGDGTFANVAVSSGLDTAGLPWCKGATWVDFDNDRYPDLFLNFIGLPSRLFRNNRDGTFNDVTATQGIQGPNAGFSCWTWDYDNDGWLDIMATDYVRSLEGVVAGLVNKGDRRRSTTLYRNTGGDGFENRSRESGLDKLFATMGSNFGDFDNDGFLDFYLGTGDPGLESLMPNRMFKNVAGERFTEVTSATGTGHLQKGHAVACGDWDRDGDVDIFVQMGGAINGDQYHSILFQNPGHSRRSITLRLRGTKSNRAGIGARIRAVVDAPGDPVVHALVSSGSSFGANTLEQTIGLGTAARIKRLEVHWPTTDITQVFENLDAGPLYEITEGNDTPRAMPLQPIALPDEPVSP